METLQSRATLGIGEEEILYIRPSESYFNVILTEHIITRFPEYRRNFSTYEFIDIVNKRSSKAMCVFNQSLEAGVMESDAKRIAEDTLLDDFEMPILSFGLEN